VFLNGGTKEGRKEAEKFYNAWMLVVPPLLHHVPFLAYFRIALRLKICASPVKDKTWGFRYS